MFHVPAHKNLAHPPAQIRTFLSRTDAGKPRELVAYHPVAVVIGGKRYDLAMHQVDGCTNWRVSDPVSGRQLVQIKKQPVDTLQAATAVRDYALNYGEDEFHERIRDARARASIHQLVEEPTA